MLSNQEPGGYMLKVGFNFSSVKRCRMSIRIQGIILSNLIKEEKKVADKYGLTYWEVGKSCFT